MKVIIDTPEGIAKQAAAIYKEILDAKPNAVLGFATGSTPLDLYAELVKMYEAGEISFKDVTTFNLDEYVGLDGTHDQSYRYFMDTNLFNHVDLDPAKTHVPSGLDTSDEALAAYDAAIEAAGGEDLHILGIGVNGHIAFNKPGDPIDTMTHVVELTQNTREVNARFFDSIDDVPTHAVTMGIKSIMHARKLILIALGEAKADAIKAAVEGPVDPACPASVLQLHPDVTFFCDEGAASKLTL